MIRPNDTGLIEISRAIEENYNSKIPILILPNLDLLELPKELGKLTHLTRLEISFSKEIQNNPGTCTLPVEIGDLINLQVLILSNLPISRLPDELENLKNLRHLSLENNQLSVFPTIIERLVTLKHLNLSNNEISELPEGIGNLINLRQLTLQNNKLTFLPENIGKLSLLQDLNLKNNRLTEIPPEIKELKNLKNLFLRDNNITRLPDEIFQLNKLELLSCRNNKINNIPAELWQMKGLQVLSLRNNLLRELPKEIGDLFNLTRLYLDNNELEKLPKELQKLMKLKVLVLHGNKLNFPSEIIEKWKEPKTIISYYLNNLHEVKEEDRKPLKEVKVMLVGQGRVGKTSLVRYLVHNKKRKPDERSTHGILREKWNVEITDNKTQKHHEVRLNIWDFGGQDIQHQTHQFFLSKRSVYLLVLDAGYDEARNKLDYWLKKIQIYGENSPIFVAVNKSDENSLKLAYSDLREKYNIKGFFNVSCEDGREISALREAIKTEIGNLGEVFQPIRKEWFAVKEYLENIKEDYISIDYYRKICKDNKIGERESQKTLLTLLHELGIILNFKQHETKVLNPEWVTRGVYRIVTSTEIMKNNGILTKDLLYAGLEALNEELSLEDKDYLSYPSEKYVFITDLMQEFELCYQISGTENFFVPALLPKESFYIGEWKERNCLGFRYNYGNGLLHESIVSRFIVKMNRYILNHTQWLTGVLLVNEQGNKALVKADISNKIVNILIDGNEPTRREFLSIIRDKFSDIHENLKGNTPVEEVSHYSYPNCFIPYEHLLQLEKAEIFTSHITIDGTLVKYDVKRMLNGVSTPKEREIKDLIEEEDNSDQTFSGVIRVGRIKDEIEIKEAEDVVEAYSDKNETEDKVDVELSEKSTPSLIKIMSTFIITFILIMASIGLYDYLQNQGYLSRSGFYLALVFTVIFIVVITTFALTTMGIIPADKIPDILKPVFDLIGSQSTSKTDEITKK